MRKFFFEQEWNTASTVAFALACHQGALGNFGWWALLLALSIALNFIPPEANKN